MPHASRAAVRSEKQKMLAGELYDASDPELVAERLRARALCQPLAALDPAAPEIERAGLLAELLGAPTDVTPPFFCDDGRHVELGRGVYFNVNGVILDVANVTIGDRVLFGPAVQLSTATHPMSASERRRGLELGRPIVIGSDVWVRGGAIVARASRSGRAR